MKRFFVIMIICAAVSFGCSAWAADAPAPVANTPAAPVANAPAPSAMAPVAAAEAKPITLSEAIDTAIRNHPSIAIGDENVLVAESKIGQARAGYLPHVDATASYTRYGFPDSVSSTSSGGSSISNSPSISNGVSGSRNPAFNSYSADVTLTQTIFDFGRNYMNIQIQKLGAESSRQSLADTVSQIVLGVKQAYINAELAQRQEAVARDVVAQMEQHLAQASKFFEVGLKPRFDVTTAEANLSSAKLDLIKAENATSFAMVTLNVNMGTAEDTVYNLEDVLKYDGAETRIQDSLDLAYANRADLRSLELQYDAAKRAVTAVKLDFLPTINGSATYRNYGADTPLKNHEWIAGVTATMNILSGGLTWYQIDQAKATRDALRENVRLVKQQIYLAVQQAWLGVMNAAKGVPAAELSLKASKENLDIAVGRYDAGVGSPVEVTDAQISYKDAQLALLQTLADYKNSQASLSRAVGGK